MLVGEEEVSRPAPRRGGSLETLVPCSPPARVSSPWPAIHHWRPCPRGSRALLGTEGASVKEAGLLMPLGRKPRAQAGMENAPSRGHETRPTLPREPRLPPRSQARGFRRAPVLPCDPQAAALRAHASPATATLSHPPGQDTPCVSFLFQAQGPRVQQDSRTSEQNESVPGFHT